ncbi:MAG TPA: sigma-70 family RNA polymerase sigma factor [Pirellulaceae bacterium]|nr:sigma-70 family RNA polymerase sigma factor [Pirellulaceae bacterium]
MDSGSEPRTSPTLLGRLQQAPADQSAWAEFVDRYGRKIYGWCRQWGLQDADAQDVTQMVLARIADKMRAFAYDPTRSFRGWLRTLAHHAWSDFVSDRRTGGVGSGDTDVLHRLHSVEAGDDLARQLDEECERDLLEQAMARVRLRVEARTWDAFRLLAVDGRSGAEAAAQLGMKVPTVFVARSKVQRMIQEEARKLDAPEQG